MENRTTKTRRARQRKARARKVLLTISLLLVVAAASVGGTLAWLTATTAPVTNTFTYGDINIELTETTGGNYKIIPGVNIAKDPKVTVKAGSEACYLFVKVDEAHWPTFTEEGSTTKKVSYTLADDWKPLDGEAGVYYCEVGASKDDQVFSVLKGDTITVSNTLTKTEINSVAVNPKLTFTAYAIQKLGFDTAKAAWEEASK